MSSPSTPQHSDASSRWKRIPAPAPSQEPSRRWRSEPGIGASQLAKPLAVRANQAVCSELFQAPNCCFPTWNERSRTNTTLQCSQSWVNMALRYHFGSKLVAPQYVIQVSEHFSWIFDASLHAFCVWRVTELRKSFIKISRNPNSTRK